MCVMAVSCVQQCNCVWKENFCGALFDWNVKLYGLGHGCLVDEFQVWHLFFKSSEVEKSYSIQKRPEK